MLRVESIKLPPGAGTAELAAAAARLLRVPEKELLALRILRRSVDAREDVRLVYAVEVSLRDEAAALRRARGLSQERLAEQLQVSRQAVSRWENGSALPDASNVFQLSKLFGVSADYLLDDRYGEEVSQMTLGTLQEGTEPPRSGPAGSKQR